MNEQASFDSRSTAHRLVAHLADAARAITVTDVRIGLGYTAVKLADGRAGVAYTFRDQAQEGCSVFNGIRPLSGRSAANLLALLGASTPLVPEVFSAAGVTMLSGVVVTAAEEVLGVVSEGGGMRQFSPHVRKVTTKVDTLAPRSERSTR